MPGILLPHAHSFVLGPEVINKNLSGHAGSRVVAAASSLALQYWHGRAIRILSTATEVATMGHPALSRATNVIDKHGLV